MRNFPQNLRHQVEQAKSAQASPGIAAVSLHSLDLTSLNDSDTPSTIDALAAKADQGPLGHVAATCVYPRFLSQIFNATASKGIHRATVINFPDGQGTPDSTAAQTRAAIASGADEIDIVLDYRRFLGGDRDAAAQLLLSCREACGTAARMKVILETAAFEDYRELHAAATLALDCGADFLKTSTGKSPQGGATLEAVATMLQAIRDRESDAGIKVSGGVKTVADCAQHVALTEGMMGKDWISTDTFRIGASGVLTDILNVLGKPSAPEFRPRGY